MLKPEQVANGIMAFAEAEILPAMDGWHLIAGSAALILLGQRAETVLAALKDNKAAAALGIIDKEGNIDVDAAAEALKAASKKHGKIEVDIPLLGAFKFGESDIDKLLEHIKKA